MELGWIDFSKSERSKVMSVLDLLSQKGALDELGIAPVRDGFADVFFPGTSTIQTRAKYFLIVPYAMKELERSGETNPRRLLKDLDAIEKECAEILNSKGVDLPGVIGSRALGQSSWVKRAPSSIYWSGLRTYGIFSGSLSLAEYIEWLCEQKNQKSTLAKLGNRHDREEDRDKDQDDRDAGGAYRVRFWTIPTYQEGWKDHLNISLTQEEGAFLKRQIIITHPDSMMAFILNNRRKDILACGSFENLRSLIHQFPEQVQKDYWLARDFAEFLFVLRILYNMIISDGQNERANQLWSEKYPHLPEIARVDLEGIFSRLLLYRNNDLRVFLRKARERMAAGDVEGLKEAIRKREYNLKDVRAKTTHPGEFNITDWYSGGMLDYRFSNASRIINDIFESEDQYAESK